MKLNPFNQTFGMPPSSYVSDSAIINSMPVLQITPGIPNFQSGLTLFRVEDSWTQYNKILTNLGFELSSQPIKLAFIADNFPTDSFTNEYGETFLQKFTDVASSGMQQLSQMTGSATGTEALANLGKSMQTIGGDMGGMMGDILGGIGSGAAGIGTGIKQFKEGAKGTFLGGAANMLDTMVAGNRVDFPMIWRNSGFTPSYTVTIRLYNPNPSSDEATKQYIVGPLAVILALGIPRSNDGKTFNWPFFHKIKATGIYNLSPAVITNVTVVKGGDQQQISYNQRLAMVDVRIDFTSLYNTMILEEGSSQERERPTVRNYLDSLTETDDTLSYSRNQMRVESGNAAGTPTQSGNVLISSNQSLSPAEALLLAKNEAAARKQAPTVTEEEVGNRVSTSQSSISATLTPQIPSGLTN